MAPRAAARCARATLAVLLLAAALAAAGEAVPLHKVPRPVLDAVRARFPDARLAGAEREWQRDRLLYEVAVRQGGQALDVVVTPEGAIVLIKREVDAGQLPAAAAGAVAERHRGGTVRVVEEVTRVDGARETLSHFEIVVATPAGRLVEIDVTTDGRILESRRP